MTDHQAESSCDHANVEHDELQVDVDRFEILPTGTCTDCGLRVVAWIDQDPDGKTGGYNLEDFDE